MKIKSLIILFSLIAINVMGQGTIAHKKTNVAKSTTSIGVEMKTPSSSNKATSKHSKLGTSNYTPRIETFYVNGVSFQMVEVKGGTFMMGTTTKQCPESGRDEKPAHKVTLSSFYIGKTEVTQELWKAIMGNNPSHIYGENLPVDKVSWNDCQTFISRLNSVTGKNFRLPTEAEWEFAARGGNKSRGYKYCGSNHLSDVAWYWDNSEDEMHIVGTKYANELGLYDMSGNVEEWCSDWYNNYTKDKRYQTDSTRLFSGTTRVSRGGKYSYGAEDCRSTCRMYGDPDNTAFGNGLRLVLSLL